MEKAFSENNNIYICTTYYHLLISLCKCLVNKTRATIVLAPSWKDKMLLDDEGIIINLRKYAFFAEIIVFNDYIDNIMHINELKMKDIRKYIFLKKLKSCISLDLSRYQNIYVYNENTPLGRLLNMKKVYYTLLEDGTDCFKNNKQIIKSKWGIKKIIKNYIMGFKDLGESKYIKNIEVNDKKDVFVDKVKLIELNKKELFNALSEDDKQLLLKIFSNNMLDLNHMKNATMIITQPFFTDEILDDEHTQLLLYKKIINEYTDKENIIIKVHPRDKTNYKKLNYNLYIDYGTYPIELLNFLAVRFKKIITITSTSIHLLHNTDERIMLGWKWLEDCKKGGFNEK